MSWQEKTNILGIKIYICEHGIIHPDERQAKIAARYYGHREEFWIGHRDECYKREDFPGREK